MRAAPAFAVCALQSRHALPFEGRFFHRAFAGAWNISENSDILKAEHRRPSQTCAKERMEL